MLDSKIKALGPVVSDKKIFFKFFLCKIFDPLGRVAFGPRDII